MKAYAMYCFERKVDTSETYILVGKKGKADNVKFGVFADTTQNKISGYAGKEYIRREIPVAESVKRYFAYTFTTGSGKVLTSTEEFDSLGRTFGDGKKVGTTDLILIQVSPDGKRLVMYFVRNRGFSKATKTDAFSKWTNGESIELV